MWWGWDCNWFLKIRILQKEYFFENGWAETSKKGGLFEWILRGNDCWLIKERKVFKLWDRN